MNYQCLVASYMGSPGFNPKNLIFSPEKSCSRHINAPMGKEITARINKKAIIPPKPASGVKSITHDIAIISYFLAYLDYNVFSCKGEELYECWESF